MITEFIGIRDDLKAVKFNRVGIVDVELVIRITPERVLYELIIEGLDRDIHREQFDSAKNLKDFLEQLQSS